MLTVENINRIPSQKIKIQLMYLVVSAHDSVALLGLLRVNLHTVCGHLVGHVGEHQLHLYIDRER
jgi:hypothetical protein